MPPSIQQWTDAAIAFSLASVAGGVGQQASIRFRPSRNLAPCGLAAPRRARNGWPLTGNRSVQLADWASKTAFFATGWTRSVTLHVVTGRARQAGTPIAAAKNRAYLL